jgi:hypothetical protein
MGTHALITTAGISAQRQAACLAIAQYRHSRAYAAALELAATLLRYDGSHEFYMYHADASRLMRLVASYATPEKVLLRMTMFALEFAEQFEEGMETVLDVEMAYAFVKLAPKRQRGTYVRERTRLVIAGLLRETIWPFAFGLAWRVRKDKREREDALKVSKTIDSEQPNMEAQP